MDLNIFVANLKEKYNYSDEMVVLLFKIIPAIVEYYGEDKKQLIYDTFNDCEIHIQGEKENAEEYLNQYFGNNKKWEIPFLGAGFHDTELFQNDGQISSKSIVYKRTNYFGLYTPFDFNNSEHIRFIVHEMCHAIKERGQIKVEGDHIIRKSGLLEDYCSYNPNDNTFTEIGSKNVGIEEALNTYDEVNIMTAVTGSEYKPSGYQGMAYMAGIMMQNKALANAIRASQFGSGDEWKQVLGEEASEFLSQNFEDWVNVLYSSPSEVLNSKDGLINKMKQAQNNIATFLNNYNSLNGIVEEENEEKTL